MSLLSQNATPCFVLLRRSIKRKYSPCLVHHFIHISSKFNPTYLASLETFGSPLEFEIHFCGFEQYLAAEHEFVMTWPMVASGLLRGLSAVGQKKPLVPQKYQKDCQETCWADLCSPAINSFFLYYRHVSLKRRKSNNPTGRLHWHLTTTLMLPRGEVLLNYFN